MNTDIRMRENFDEHNSSSKKANLISLKTKNILYLDENLFLEDQYELENQKFTIIYSKLYIFLKRAYSWQSQEPTIWREILPPPTEKINGVNTNLLFRPTTSTKLLQKKRFARNFMKSNKQLV